MAMFPYSPILPECIDHREQPPVGSLLGVMELVLVSRTDSLEWGQKDIASARARLEQEVTPLNERLLRSYHPSLASCGNVYAGTEQTETKYGW
ncbi:hypothetical protein VTN77DRAFT_488 [Rasamsonia byssochlamydoides]|uniref:uncharacterized protein n=1 Tax=Rasamsonia byssochlamydoides TaxID=89139 RepID=UPI00374321FE